MRRSGTSPPTVPAGDVTVEILFYASKGVAVLSWAVAGTGWGLKRRATLIVLSGFRR
jgi:hypothetical protein